jgi:hypothetical protein
MPIVLNTVLGDVTIPSGSEESEEEMETEPSSEDEPEENYNPLKTFVKKSSIMMEERSNANQSLILI